MKTLLSSLRKNLVIKLMRLAQMAPRLSEGHFLMIISVMVGVLTALAAILFHHLILFFEHVFLRDLSKVFSPFMGRYSLILIPAIGAGIAGIILHFFAKDAKGHGIPEVMEAVALHGGRIRPRVSIFKMITSSMTIGSGGSSGQEGPIIQIGSAIGSGVGQLFGMSAARNRHLLGCGAAAGIAAIFNAPIAGVIFALEAIIGEFTARVFSPIVIAAVVASVISRSVMGSYPIFKVPSFQLISPWELFNYVILGIMCAVMATIFIRFLYFTEDIFNKGFIAKTLKVPEPLRPFIGGLGVGFLGLYSFYLMGTGYSGIDAVMRNQFPLIMLIILAFGKIITTSLTVGSGAPGGTFAPALFIGAMIGGAFGQVLHAFDLFGMASSMAYPGAYAIVGMAGMFSAVFNVPITAMIIIFEMTGNYQIILPVMLTCVISSLLMNVIKQESISAVQLNRRGVKISGGQDSGLMETLTVRQAMNPDVISIPMGTKVREVIKIFDENEHHGYPIINDKEELCGIVTLGDLKIAIGKNQEENLIEEIATMEVVETVYPDEWFATALRRLGRRDCGRLPVVSRTNNKKLVGIVTRGDIIKIYNVELAKRIKDRYY